MLDGHHNTYQIVYPQFQHSVADTGLGPLDQRITFCQEQELNLENEASPTAAQPPGTLFLLIFTTLQTLIPVADTGGGPGPPIFGKVNFIFYIAYNV